MKRVVLVAPEFPPSNTAGAHRPRLLAKHLEAFGWTPTVLTVRRDQIEGPLDPALDRLVDPSLQVIRTGALPVRPVRLIGDLGLRTLPAHARALWRFVDRREVDAAVFFGPPWFSFALGPLVCRRRNVPYVLDYIDPWISDWTASHPFPSRGWWYHRGALAVEPRALRSAAHVTAVSDGILADLRHRYPWLDETSTSSMPYGAEPADIEAADRLGARPPDFSQGDAVTIAFTGALQPSSQPLLRAVLGAVAKLRASGSPAGRRLRLRLYGTSNMTAGHGRFAALQPAKEMGVDDIVSEIPERVSYLEAMAVLRACDLVLVMGSTDPYYHASKLYPAIVAGKPILALCHVRSSIRTVMEETGAGDCITFETGDDLAALVDAIAVSIERLAAAGARPIIPAHLERFTARASTAVLARALDASIHATAVAEAI